MPLPGASRALGQVAENRFVKFEYVEWQGQLLFQQRPVQPIVGQVPQLTLQLPKCRANRRHSEQAFEQAIREFQVEVFPLKRTWGCAAAGKQLQLLTVECVVITLTVAVQ
ncbi:hypothetical protein D9M71_207130 [compost metagenome]